MVAPLPLQPPPVARIESADSILSVRDTVQWVSVDYNEQCGWIGSGLRVANTPARKRASALSLASSVATAVTDSEPAPDGTVMRNSTIFRAGGVVLSDQSPGTELWGPILDVVDSYASVPVEVQQTPDDSQLEDSAAVSMDQHHIGNTGVASTVQSTSIIEHVTLPPRTSSLPQNQREDLVVVTSSSTLTLDPTPPSNPSPHPTISAYQAWSAQHGQQVAAERIARVEAISNLNQKPTIDIDIQDPNIKVEIKPHRTPEPIRLGGRPRAASHESAKKTRLHGVKKFFHLKAEDSPSSSSSLSIPSSLSTPSLSTHSLSTPSTSPSYSRSSAPSALPPTPPPTTPYPNSPLHRSPSTATLPNSPTSPTKNIILIPKWYLHHAENGAPAGDTILGFDPVVQAAHSLISPSHSDSDSDSEDEDEIDSDPRMMLARGALSLPRRGSFVAEAVMTGRGTGWMDDGRKEGGGRALKETFRKFLRRRGV
ncbi:hypothetical protein HDV00_005872 [Rhizophlyctis rosea]|nr:hypothetical protein HDV00_005872 [Rhizophlyctis rosea]